MAYVNPERIRARYKASGFLSYDRLLTERSRFNIIAETDEGQRVNGKSLFARSWPISRWLAARLLDNPNLLAPAAPCANHPPTILIAGCGIGAEAYTMAMALTQAGVMARHPDLRIIAFDQITSFVDLARTGIYPQEMVDDFPEHREAILPFLVAQPATQTYQVQPEIAAQVSFKHAKNLTDLALAHPPQVVIANHVSKFSRRAGFAALAKELTSHAHTQLLVATFTKPPTYEATREALPHHQIKFVAVTGSDKDYGLFTRGQLLGLD